eukprot:5526200-Ditylum_brightwellii.AAC.1
MQSAYKLKLCLKNINIPACTRIFMANAKSMYTNIDIDAALLEIATYLCNDRRYFCSTNIKELIKALNSITQWDAFTFGDTIWHQKTGTSMGTLSA